MQVSQKIIACDFRDQLNNGSKIFQINNNATSKTECIAG